MLTHLLESNFLALSRRQPSLFQSPSEFSLKNGTLCQIIAPGIISFAPPCPSEKAIVLSCGVHGNETAPIEILADFVDSLVREERQVSQRVLFIFANLPAMDIAERFVDENMNRLFSGAHSQGGGLINPERCRAKQLESAVEDFFLNSPEGERETRFHYDLHTAIRSSKNEKFAVYPLLHNRLHSKTQFAFLAACGIRTILLSESPTTTFSYFSSTQFNAHAFTVELGKVRPFGQNDMSRFAEAESHLIQLVCDAQYQAPQVDLEDMLIYKVNQVIDKHAEDFKLNFADDLPNFSDFSEGAILATEGTTSYTAEYSGEAIVFPNAGVAIGQRALLTVIPTHLEALSD